MFVADRIPPGLFPSLLVALVGLASPTSPAAALEVHVCDCASGSDPDCTPGSDAASGSREAPLQSWTAARSSFAVLGPGDSVRFCRGGAWDASGGTTWTNPSCTAVSPCVVGAYAPPWGSGDESRPRIRRTDGGDGFALDDGGAGHEEGYRFEGLALEGSGGAGSGFFVFNEVDDVEIVDVEIRGFGIGVHVAGSNPCGADPACDGRNDRIVLRDSWVVANESQGWLGASDDSRILRTVFEDNGSLPTFHHSIYLGGESRGMRVRGNLLVGNGALGGACDSTSFVAHGVHDDLLIEGNEIREVVGGATEGCWGLTVDPAYADPEAFTDVVIRGNVVRNVGNVAIGIGSCSGCTLENNLVIQEQPFGGTGLAVPVRSGGTGDLPTNRVTVRNNSVWFAPGVPGVGIAVGGEGAEHRVVSNALRLEGPGPGTDCFALDLAPSSYTEVDHNVCSLSESGAEWVAGFGSLDSWRSSTGFDTASSDADPQFRDPQAGNLAPSSASSPIVDAGHPTMSTTFDRAGSPRVGLPDVGAEEWGVSTVFADGFESGGTSNWSPGDSLQRLSTNRSHAFGP